jgi:hypothetical protein
MKREMYMVVTEDYNSNPFDTLEKAEKVFEIYKDDMMSEGV